MGDANAQFIVRYWGVRGSIPTPGQETVRYGGNTTCLEFRCDDQVIVIDTGTGARGLGASLMKEAAGEGLNVTILYSHHHRSCRQQSGGSGAGGRVVGRLSEYVDRHVSSSA